MIRWKHGKFVHLGDVITKLEGGSRWVLAGSFGTAGLLTVVREEFVIDENSQDLMGDAVFCRKEWFARLSRANTSWVDSLPFTVRERERLNRACSDYYMDEEPRGYTILELLHLTGEDLKLSGLRIGDARVLHLNDALKKWGYCLSDYR